MRSRCRAALTSTSCSNRSPTATGPTGTRAERDCVHCQAALAEFAALWAPVIDTAALPVPAPPGLTAAVISQIRVLVRDVWYTLQTTDLGVIRIAARIVAAMARDSARMVPGVRVVLGRSTHSKLAELARSGQPQAPSSSCRSRRPRPHRRGRPRRSGHLRRSRPRRGTRHPAACHRHSAGEHRPANHHRERRCRRHPHRRRSVGAWPGQPDRIAVHRTRTGFLPR